MTISLSARLAVVMQRRPIENRWQTEVWEPVEVRPDAAPGAAPELLSDADGLQRWLYPGLQLVLQKFECEGYWQNLVSAVPRIFVMWRMHGEQAVPERVTASYDEASAWLDASEMVEGVAMPEPLVLWVGDFTKQHFHPEPKKRIRPQSFKRPKERAQS